MLAAGAAVSLLGGGASLAFSVGGAASLAPLNLRNNEGGLAILLPLPVRYSAYVIYALSFMRECERPRS